jgi:hypothetical protein
MSKTVSPLAKSAKAKSWKSHLKMQPGMNCITTSISHADAKIIYDSVGFNGNSIFLKVKGKETDPINSLGKALCDAWSHYGINADSQTVPTAKQLEEQASKIAELCRKLHDACMIDGEMRHGLAAGGLWAQAAIQDGGEGHEKVKAALSGVSDLGRWASGMAMREAKFAAPDGHAGGTKDEAFDQLIKQLHGLFVRYWGWVSLDGGDTETHKAGVSLSSDGKKYGGPYFRFVDATLAHFGIQKTNAALGKVLQRQLKAMDN